MKKFFYSFLATMAGIWVSVLLVGLLVIVTIASIVGSSAPSPEKIEEGSVLHFELSGSMMDLTVSPSFMQFIQEMDNPPLSLEAVTSALRTAKDDPKIAGAFFEFKGLEAGLAQCEEIRDAISEFREAGKWVWTYSDNYTQSEYFIAAAADRVVLNPIGMVDIHGLSASTFYFKDLLDKLGVEMQVVKVGTYKSAVEPFVLTDMSEANREQINHFLGRIWDSMKATLAIDRKVAPDSVDTWADQFSFNFTAQEYLDRKMVDEVRYRTELDRQLLSLPGVKATDEKADTSDVRYPRMVGFKSYNTAMLAGMMLPFKSDGTKSVAILYAEGDITDDGSDGIAATRLVAQINEIAENESIDGLILRVNSGGGSAFASEQIWKALTEYKATTGKPLYVSMGNMAASGGYYISCCADKIYASPLTLTGSIGIFGLIPNAEGLLKNKLGVNIVDVSTNEGRFPGIFHPMSAEQRAAMQGYVDRGYELFVKRCAEGRGLTVDQIKAIAEGRVWDGLSALENGLIDELGGLNATVQAMALALDVDMDHVSLCVYPQNQINWWESFAEMTANAQTLSQLASGDLNDNAAVNAIISRLRAINPLQARTNMMIIR